MGDQKTSRREIGIIDYGMGNLGSVCKAMSYLGYRPKLVDSPEGLAAVSGLILPGVGAMAPAMAALTAKGLISGVLDYVRQGKPFLGICLGMQMLFDYSEENGQTTAGLGLIPGKVVRFPVAEGFKIPQIGWSQLADSQSELLVAGDYFYFVHSYYCQPKDPRHIAARAEYSFPYTAAVAKDNIFATQFHPEKSGEAGLVFLQEWLHQTRR